MSERRPLSGAPDRSLLRAINHNLLPVLRALLRECSVTRAAETLGMTQPAASTALARLRLILGDPLLVKTGRRMEISPRGEALLPLVEDLCERLDLLWKKPDFSATTATRRFSLSSPDYVQAILAPALIDRLGCEAPGVSMRFLDVSVDDIFRRTISDIDLIVTIRQSVEHAASGNFVVESLYKDRIVAVVGPKHRLHGAVGVSRKDYERDKFLVFVGGAQFLEKRYDSLRNALSAPSPPVAVSQHYNALMLIAAQSDCVALIPLHLATIACALTPLTILDDNQSDFVLDICLAWDKRYEADPAHRWMRDQLHHVASSF